MQQASLPRPEVQVQAQAVPCQGAEVPLLCLQMVVERSQQPTAATSTLLDSQAAPLQPFSPASQDGFSTPLSHLGTTFAEKSR